MAVKEIDVEKSSTEYSEELLNEIDILKKCRHKSIVSYFGTCRIDKRHKIWVRKKCYILSLDSNGLLSFGFCSRSPGDQQRDSQRRGDRLYRRSHFGRSDVSPCSKDHPQVVKHVTYSRQGMSSQPISS